MNKSKAKHIFEAALSYCENHRKDELERAKEVSKDTFNRLTASEFLEEYCHVVYVSGFKVSIIEAIFPRLRIAFNNFNLESLVRMRSVSEVLSIFNNERKGDCFLKGSQAIAKEGFPMFKSRLKEQGMSVLEALPGIGKINKFQLAKNIGFIDEAKPDIWLTRAAELCNATIDDLVTFLSKEYCMSRHVVDVVIWRHGADNKLGHHRQ
jgi:hypothetical protein